MENSPFPKEETSLLTLSRQDLSDTKSNNVNNDTLVLMQMPACVSANDVKGARIVATPSQQACLVLQDKAQTYSMSRVETSNAYIMAPPPTPTTTDQRPRKKTKRDTTLVSVPVRLLQPGGSGASFIELKRKNLQLADLQEQLKEHVLYPFDESKRWTGRTLSSLAVDLQCSEREVLNGLKRIQALGITTESNDGTKNTTYGILSEEALQECKISIVATLMECDEFQDYAGTGISKATCVEQVMSRVPAGEQYTDMDQVIQHTLRTLQKNDNDDDGATNDDAKIQLDVNKVAACVVHGLFTKQSEPWEEQELLAKWQRETPGVGEKYQVSLEMLRGVALQCTSNKNKYKFFPEEKLPTDLAKRFEALFEEREKWALDTLKPYVQRLTTEELSETDLLLKHTCIITEDVDGVPTKLYVKK